MRSKKCAGCEHEFDLIDAFPNCGSCKRNKNLKDHYKISCPLQYKGCICLKCGKNELYGGKCTDCKSCREATCFQDRKRRGLGCHYYCSEFKEKKS